MKEFNAQNCFKIEAFFALFLFLIALIAACVFCAFDADSTIASHLLAYLIDFVVVLGFFYFVKKEKTIFNQYSFFWLSLSLFSFGHIFLYTFGLENLERFIFNTYQLEIVNEYMLYGILSFVVLLYSGMIILNLKNTSAFFAELYDVVDHSKKIFWGMFLVSAPFFLFRMFTSIQIAFLYGYGDVFEQKGSAFVASMAMLYVPSLFGLLYSYKSNLLKFIFLFFLFIPVIGYLIVGSRSAPVALILCLIFFWDNCVKRISKKQSVLIFLIGVLFMVLIPAIAEYRVYKNESFNVVFENMLNSGFNEILKNFFGEFGGSAQIWLRLQHLIPSVYNYSYGFSYLAAVLTCIPSFLLGGFSFAKYSNLSDWITNVEHASYGLGFSFLGETFYNFGWFGIAGAFFLGLFIFYMLSGLWLPRLMMRYKCVFSTISLYIFSLIGRNSMYLGIRQIFYCMLIPILLICLTRPKK